MADAIVVIIILVAFSQAIRYIIKEKRRGNGCIGCPNASKCGGGCQCEKTSQTKSRP